ncbi:MAG: type II secretion system protein [Deltaproteobacteria bacterium]|nr:type II secretion system protein [Deltaproteobacteria bacterium]
MMKLHNSKIWCNRFFLQECGFSLVELVIVVFISGAIISIMVSVMPVLLQSAKSKETRALLVEADTALQGYLAAGGRCPCPDTSANGNENRNDGGTPADFGDDTCVAYAGDLPWVTLGLSAAEDAWHNQIRYAVDEGLVQTAAAGFCDRIIDAVTSTAVTHATEPGDTGRLYVTSSVTAADLSVNMAYVMFSGGAGDADGINGFYDGRNGAVPALEFESAEKIIDADYDDIVLGRSCVYLYGRNCAGSSWRP